MDSSTNKKTLMEKLNAMSVEDLQLAIEAAESIKTCRLYGDESVQLEPQVPQLQQG